MCIAVTLSLFVGLAATASAMHMEYLSNALLNPGFDEPGPNQYVPANYWPKFGYGGANSVLNSTDQRTGDYCIEEIGTGTDIGSTGVYQKIQTDAYPIYPRVIEVIPGEDYTLSGYAKLNYTPLEYDPNSDGVNLRFIWKDSSASTILDEFVQLDGLTTSYAQYSATKTAPAGATYVNVGFYQKWVNNTTYWDDASLSGNFMVPEPTTIGMSLLGVGLLALRRRR